MSILDFLKKKKKIKKPEIKEKEEKVPTPKEVGGVGKLKNERTKMKTKAKVKKDAGKKAKEIVKKTTPLGKGMYSHVLLQPRITEKATELSELNVYTFDVNLRATKSEVKKAVEEAYNVVPIKIRIAPVPSKLISVRGRRGRQGVKSGGKKAMVHLKEGETIEFI